MKIKNYTTLTILAHLIFFSPVYAATIDVDKVASATRSLLYEMVAADTTNLPGNEARIVKIVEARLKKVGIPYEVTEFAPGRQNIVARLKGSGSAKPMLILAHIDVVGTAGQAWTVPQHQVTEKDGYLYGRDVLDDLGMAALSIEMLVALKQAGTPLRRDIIVALTGDEESGGLGIQYILKTQPQSVSAAFALNEGGGIVLGEDGKVQRIDLQVGEKIYQDYELVAKGTTGHSSAPLKDNAIAKLGAALGKLGNYQRPARLIPATRAYFGAQAAIEKPEMAAAMRALAGARGVLPRKAVAMIETNPSQGALLRSTCVATMVSGGTRVNALPAEARANINCRILPDENKDLIRSDLMRVIADAGVEVNILKDEQSSPASDLENEAPIAIRKIAAATWPGILIVPAISTGATDSRFLRAAGIPSFGFSPIPASEQDDRRAHGIDERIPTSGIKTGVEFYYKLLLELAG